MKRIERSGWTPLLRGYWHSRFKSVTFTGSEFGSVNVSEEGRGTIFESKRSSLWQLWVRSPVRKMPAVLHSSKDAAVFWNMGSIYRYGMKERIKEPSRGKG